MTLLSRRVQQNSCMFALNMKPDLRRRTYCSVQCTRFQMHLPLCIHWLKQCHGEDRSRSTREMCFACWWRRMQQWQERSCEWVMVMTQSGIAADQHITITLPTTTTTMMIAHWQQCLKSPPAANDLDRSCRATSSSTDTVREYTRNCNIWFTCGHGTCSVATDDSHNKRQ